MLDPTSTNPAPPQEPPVVATPEPQAVADPPQADPETPQVKGPSWDDLKARHPESADDLTRLDASHREMHKRAVESHKAEVARLEEAAKARPATALDMDTLRRMVAGEDVVGGDVALPEAPDFRGVVAETIKAKGDAVLTDTEALVDVLTTAMSLAYQKATEGSIEYVKAREKSAIKSLYEPVVKAHEQSEMEAVVQRAVDEVRRLPGMATDTAFDAVYDAMTAAGRKGVDGFKATYAEMLVQHPEWTRPQAPKEPEVVVRPTASAAPPPPPAPAPPKEPTVLDLARSMSAATGGGARVATRAPGATTGKTPTRIEEVMSDPAYLAEVSVNDGRAEWERHRDAQRKRGFFDARR